jgi:alanine racemase
LKNNFPNSYATISRELLRQNLIVLKQKARAERVLAVVKCDAYRHGAREVSRAIKDVADWFAVASVDEAIDLRMAGITKPILVFGVPTYETAAAYLTHGLTATVSHKTHFSILMDGTDYHLNFDTGMGRLGFKPKQAEEVREQAILNQRLICSGIYSHHSSSDEPDSDFVQIQQNRFKDVISRFSEVPIKHMSCTGTVGNYPELDHFDMIRSGIGLVGYSSSSVRFNWLEPALEWRSKIAQIRPIEKGEVVSYSSTWSCPADGYLATLPVGYGDGIPRSLSNKLRVFINKKAYPQVGNITMDYAMVYLGNDKVNPGSDAVLIGNSYNAQDWAEAAGTNTHEILTNITDRVEKRYVE